MAGDLPVDADWVPWRVLLVAGPDARRTRAVAQAVGRLTPRGTVVDSIGTGETAGDPVPRPAAGHHRRTAREAGPRDPITHLRALAAAGHSVVCATDDEELERRCRAGLADLGLRWCTYRRRPAPAPLIRANGHPRRRRMSRRRRDAPPQRRSRR